MEKKIKIGDYGASFNNVLHMQYHRSLYTKVTGVDKQKLHLTDEMLKEWKQCIDLEEDINREVTASPLSKRLNEKDRERDEVLKFLFGVIKHHKFSPVTAERGAAEVLGLIIKPYTGIQTEAVEEETGHVYGLLRDLEKQSAELMILNLGATLTRLRTLNDEFAVLRLQRRDAAVASKLPTARMARPKTDAIWSSIADQIYASYLFAATDADRELIKGLIDIINKTFADFKTMNKQSIVPRKKPGGGGKKPSDPKKPSDGKKPDDPKKPNDPKKPEGGGDSPKPGREEDPGEDQV